MWRNLVQARPLDPNYWGSRVKILVPRCSSEHKLVPSFSRIRFIEKKTPRKWQELAVLVDMCWSSSLFFWGAGLGFLNLKAFFLGIQKQHEAAIITQMYIDTFP